MKNFTTSNKAPRCKVTEFIREKINGKNEVVCVEWFFDSVLDAFNKMDEIKERGTFCDPFLSFVYDVKENKND